MGFWSSSCLVDVWFGVVDGGRNCPAKEMKRIFEDWKPAERKRKDSAGEVYEIGCSPRLKGKDNQEVPTAGKGWRIFQTVVSGGHMGLLSALHMGQSPRSLQTLGRVCSPVLWQ